MHVQRLTIALTLCAVASCQTPTDITPRSDPSRLAQASADIVPTAGGLKAPRPSFVTTACVNASNQLEVTDTWVNQTIDPTARLPVTVVLKGTTVGSNTILTTYIGPFGPDGFVVLVSNVFKSPTGDVPWSAFSTIGASASGAFVDVAHTLRQPKTGWPGC